MHATSYAALLLLTFTCLARGLAAAPATAEITGQVFAPSIATTVVYLHTSTGAKHVAHLETDGTFTFKNVPLGSHLLQPFHLTTYFPEVQVDVGKHGVYRAQLIAQAAQQNSIVQPVPVPLRLRPAGDMHFYEKRKPVDLWSLIKSPYGLMIGFSLFIIVVMPRLKVDPEEMKKWQAEMKSDAPASPARVTGGSR